MLFYGDEKFWTQKNIQGYLLGLKINNRLSFKSHISAIAICKKAAKQLNALKRLGSFLNISQHKVLAQSFIMANFNFTVQLYGIFVQLKTNTKLKKYKSTLFALYTQITNPLTVKFWTKRKPTLWN